MPGTRRSRPGSGRWVFAGLFALICSVSNLTAQEGPAAKPAEQPEGPPSRRLIDLKLGNFRIQPAFEVREVYDSNIFLTDGHERSDFITHMVPSITLSYDTEHFQAFGSYRADFEHFATHEDLDDRNEAARTGTRYLGDGWYIGAGASYDRTVDPLDFQLTDRITIWQRDANLEAGVNIGDLETSLRLVGHSFRTRVPSFAFFENDRFDGTLKLAYPLGKGWYALGMVTGGHTNFLHRIKPDNDFVEGTLGVQAELSRVVSFVVEGGYRVQDYGPETGALSYPEDFEKGVARTTLRLRVTDDDTFLLAGSRGQGESLVSNFLTIDRVQFQYRHAFSDRLSAGLGVTHDWIHEATDEVLQDEKRVVGASVDASWSVLPWLDVYASYVFRAKDTNDDIGEYDDHQATVGAEVRF